MRYIPLALILLVAALPSRADAGPATSPAVFRLVVHGAAPGGTYWVAYGPLAGRFGLVRLHYSRGTWVARMSLPAGARTTFAYITGQGTMQTRMGTVPGNPVAVIRTIGPTDPATVSGVVVSWNAPVG